MAYQIHWKIQFKSLRSGTNYTANIYKDGTLPSGYPLTLKGGASPFVTDEDNSEDQFIPVRTQSGYLRIVDDGKAINANNQEVSYNWRDLLPLNDTDRPVTLQAGSTVVWYGFMQAQNFGGTLFGNPQEREYPIQCPLSVTEGTEVDATNTSIQNFAYLLKQIIDSIPEICRPTRVLLQGGIDARSWLLKKIDWQNLLNVSDEEVEAQYTYMQALEDLCRFWGWTARVWRNYLILTMADDTTTEPNRLLLTTANLTSLANGTSTTAGTVDEMYTTEVLTGNVFASINNEESMVRGANKCTVQADSNKAESNVVEFPETVEEYLKQQSYTTETFGNKAVNFYGDLAEFPTTGIVSKRFAGSAMSYHGSFTYIKADAMQGPAIRIKKSYNGNTFAHLETVYEHSYCNANGVNDLGIGGFQLKANIYYKAERYENYEENQDRTNIPAGKGLGRKTMMIRFGVGKTRATARWFDGQSWSDTATAFPVSVGNENNILRPEKIVSSDFRWIANHIHIRNENLSGKIFIDFLGSSETPEVDGQRSFYIMDFAVEFSRHKDYEHPSDDVVYTPDYASTSEYVSKNAVATNIESNIDLCYASENNMEAGYGVVMNIDGSPMATAPYNSGNEHPEQHLANRVTAFGATSKRMITAELQSNLVANINPRYMVTLDGTTGHPIAIGRDWRDDILRLTILEM